MIAALAGGVGGAKLAHGLQAVCPPGGLTAIVNTADDFRHLGLQICPDLDTMMYTLAGRANPETGWGVEGETWQCLGAIESLGGDSWFRLGDRDLATHLLRTERLAAGRGLSEVTGQLCRALGIASRVVPMSDQPVRTVADTDEGPLPFQEYFVRRRCEPVVRELRFEGSEGARPSPGLEAVLQDDAVAVVVICPSNPYLSVAPILSIPGVSERLRRHPAPVVAVSPIVGGAAIKGPAAKLMREFGLEPSARTVAEYYGSLLDGVIIDRADEALAEQIEGPSVLVTETVMRSDHDRARLAGQVLEFAAGLGAPGRRG